MPEGTPKELVAYIRKLKRAPLPVEDEATLEKKRGAILKAAGKILAAKASDEDAEFAVHWKIAALGDEREDCRVVGEELKKAGREKLARIVRGFRLEGTGHAGEAIRERSQIRPAFGRDAGEDQESGAGRREAPSGGAAAVGRPEDWRIWPASSPK